MPRSMTKARAGVLTGMFLVAAALTLFLTLAIAKSSGTKLYTPKAAAEVESSLADQPGIGPNGYEAYRSAMRTYPSASALPPAVVARAQQTFARIATRSRQLRLHSRSFLWQGQWKLLGPKMDATQPGVTSFSGATNNTASRITALVVDPNARPRSCRLWAGASGGGVWRTNNALSSAPELEAAEPREPRPELGRDAHARPDRQERQHALPRHGRGQPLLLRLRGGRRHLQVDRRRQALDEARATRASATRRTPASTRARTRSSAAAINAIVVDPSNSRHLSSARRRPSAASRT